MVNISFLNCTLASGLDTQLTLAMVNISPQGFIASPYRPQIIFFLISHFFCKGIKFMKQIQICNSYIFATRCGGLLIFQTLNSDRSANLSFKYQRCTLSGCKDIKD